MNAIEVLAQQQADEILQLETAYANLYHAYERGNRDEMISAYLSLIHIYLLYDGKCGCFHR